MVCFQNISYASFLERFSDKKTICFGAGGTLRDFLALQVEKIELLESIEVILDNDILKSGQSIRINNRLIPIQTMNQFLLKRPILKDFVMILFLADEYVLEVVEQLDCIDEFDNMVCIYGLQSIGWGRELFPSPYPVSPTLPTLTKHYQIPKNIHYCWFGQNAMTDLNHQCVESWTRYCPDYKVFFWNETTYDMSKTPSYVKDAYKAGKYAFVSDYVRLDVIYKYGGFYLDTDVELYKSLDDFLPYRGVYAFMEYNEISTGLGFGSVEGAFELKEMLELYERINFINDDGSYNITPCPRYTNDFFRRRGVKISNELQVVNDILFLPSSYLSPLNPVLCDDGCYNLALYALTPNTYAIHRCDNTWKSEEENASFNKKKKELADINQRLLNDWLQRYSGGQDNEKSGNPNAIL